MEVEVAGTAVSVTGLAGGRVSSGVGAVQDATNNRRVKIL
jgi:hypothetical protein